MKRHKGGAIVARINREVGTSAQLLLRGEHEDRSTAFRHVPLITNQVYLGRFATNVQPSGL